MINVKGSTIGNTKQCFTEVVVIIVGSDGKVCIAKGLLDT